VNTFQPFGTSQLNEILIPGFGRNTGTKTHNVALSYSHFLSKAILNELRFGYLRVVRGQTSINAGNDFGSRAALLGVSPDPRDMGYPQISFSGVRTAFNANFGRIFSTAEPARQMQFGLKLVF
jgi:hypothetical protein